MNIMDKKTDGQPAPEARSEPGNYLLKAANRP